MGETSKILRSTSAFFLPGGIYKPKMHSLSFDELLGIWVGSVFLKKLS
jgi:hypothetical protein